MKDEIDKFIPTMFGWVSPMTPPTNNKDVIVLCYLKDSGFYQEYIGYYEKKWHLTSLSCQECEGDGEKYFMGWIPMPYNPDNC